MARKISPLDRHLSERLRAKGIDESPREVARAREHGLNPARPHHSLGRPLGSVAVATPDELERAAAAARLLKEHGTYHRAVLAMFGEGRFEVATDKLEDASEGSLDSALAVIKKHGAAGRSAQEVAHHAAQWAAGRAAKARGFRAGRILLREKPTRFRRKERPRFISVRELLASLLEDTFLIMIEGRATSQQAFRELLEAVNVQELLVNPVTDKTVEALRLEQVAEVLPHASASALKSRARRSDPTALREGLEELVAFRELGRAYGGCIRRVLGWRCAFPWLVVGSASDVALTWAVPAVAWAREHWTRQFDQFFARCPLWIAKFTAMNALLDLLPDEFQWRPGAWDKHTSEQAARLRLLLERFAREQPQHWTALHAEG